MTLLASFEKKPVIPANGPLDVELPGNSGIEVLNAFKNSSLTAFSLFVLVD